MRKGYKSPTISIAMATYNGAKYIREQLDSLANQTILPRELVVTDDRSTDNTLEIIKDFSTSAPFEVRLYQNENKLGFADNFLTASELCTSEIIAFCDQDDVWLSNKLEMASAAFDDSSIMLTSHSAELLIGSKRSGRFDPNFKFTKVIRRNSGDILKVYPGFSILFRASLLKLTGNFERPTNIASTGSLPVSLAHDGWICMLAATFGEIKLFSDPLVLYRQHEGNTWGSRPKVPFSQRISLSLSTKDYARNRDVDIEFMKVFRNLARKLPEPYALEAEKRAEYFKRRSSYNDLRDRLYKPSPISKKFMSFGKILISGGYFNTKVKSTLGIRSCLKDFLILCLGYKTIKGDLNGANII